MDKLAVLSEHTEFETGIEGYVAAIPHCLLGRDGLLQLSPGYVWDLASGPAIDTPAMVAASLIHDALYDLIVAEQLPGKYRKTADKLFRRILKDWGVGPVRRTYSYVAVRYFYPVWRFFCDPFR